LRSASKSIADRLVAALFGFTGIAAASADIYIFIVIFVVLRILGLTVMRG
jgi:uncharacterized membrane protein YtjA (UPF0391 family)